MSGSEPRTGPPRRRLPPAAHKLAAAARAARLLVLVAAAAAAGAHAAALANVVQGPLLLAAAHVGQEGVQAKGVRLLRLLLKLRAQGGVGVVGVG